jgi:hypothetical protein
VPPQFKPIFFRTLAIFLLLALSVPPFRFLCSAPPFSSVPIFNATTLPPSLATPGPCLAACQRTLPLRGLPGPFTRAHRLYQPPWNIHLSRGLAPPNLHPSSISLSHIAAASLLLADCSASRASQRPCCNCWARLAFVRVCWQLRQLAFSRCSIQPFCKPFSLSFYCPACCVGLFCL